MPQTREHVVELGKPCPWGVGLAFAVRAGNHTVAAGVVTALLDRRSQAAAQHPLG